MEEVVLRLEELLFPSIADVAVLSVAVNDEAVRIEARRTVAGTICPGCGSWSRRIHSPYLRFPADVPGGGRRVALCLRVRRFLCPVISCGRRTFAEQLPGLTRRPYRRLDENRLSSFHEQSGEREHRPSGQLGG
ncbi:transposase family protein [Streptomyces erythrochromogenes]|uniref:transposase family protein n=1 Tax=Streptomyces erythrochromogenes TaxID=285574 RepID=UPI0036814BFE